ncbi:hypothetical protein B0H10DRAFT_2230642 [Mycena sp. CBHHK59/15]|nr:hypothetical protein B0H10DRAFT_2230642 [Mycena sp. CBHHK59/15]
MAFPSSTSNPFLVPTVLPPLAGFQQAGPQYMPIYPYAPVMPVPHNPVLPQTNPFRPHVMQPVFQTGPLHPSTSFDDQYGVPDSASQFVAQNMPAYSTFRLSPMGWTTANFLDKPRRNYTVWARCVHSTLSMHSRALLWLHKDHAQTSYTMFPCDHGIWHMNDVTVWSFIEVVCTTPELEHIADCEPTADVWATLKVHHEKTGALAQIQLMKELFAVRYTDDGAATITATTSRLKELNDAIWASTPLDPAVFLTWAMINSLEKFPGFRDSVLGTPNLNHTRISERLEIKGALKTPTSATTNTVYSSNPRNREVCTTPNCLSKASHTWAYCTKPGGGMAGKHIDDAREAQHAAAKHSAGGPSGVKHDSAGRAYVTEAGRDYYLEAAPIPIVPPAAPALNANFVNLITDPLPTIYELETFVAEDEPTISIDWNNWTRSPMANVADEVDVYTLFSDTGANIHISPYHSDFSILDTIPLRFIRGFQGSSINVTGIGTIITNKFTLENTLFVPEASIRLLSVIRLCQSKQYSCHLDASTTWITDSAGDLVCEGSVHPSRDLYQLHCNPPSHPIAASTITVRKMHLHLGHLH